MPKEYALQPLIEAVTALDWSRDHPVRAAKALQAAVLKNEGEDLSDVDALKLLARLIERRLIRSKLDPPGMGMLSRRKARYEKVPASER